MRQSNLAYIRMFIGIIKETFIEVMASIKILFYFFSLGT